MGLARAAIAAAALVASLAATAFDAARAGDGLPGRFGVVVIDAGHGGEDDGAKGPGGLREKDLVLDVARRLARLLAKGGLEVVQTRPDDRFVPLETRTSVANDARGDLFISIHANASRSARPRGSETYFVSLEASDPLASEVAERENEAFGKAPPAAPRLDPLAAILGDMAVNEHVRESSAFAKRAQTELAGVAPLPSRGVKQAPFVVLMGVRMPAALIEIGFVTNERDAQTLSRLARREEIAQALARAVFAFRVDYDRRRGVEANLSPAP